MSDDRLPDEIHGVLWIDGDTGTRHYEYGDESRPDPADHERAVYVKKNAPMVPLATLQEAERRIGSLRGEIKATVEEMREIEASSVPLATLRDFVKKWEAGLTGPSPLYARTVLAGLTFLLDEFERTTNHNEGEPDDA